MNPASGTRLLHHLSRLYGLQTAYYDVSHRRQPAATESLLAALRSLGAPLMTLHDIPLAWREKRQTLWRQPLEPVTVYWDNRPALIPVRLPSTASDTTLDCHLKLETGEERRWQQPATGMPVVDTTEIEGIRYVASQLTLTGRLPRGYHRLMVEIAGEKHETLIISAPAQAYLPPSGPEDRSWGVFLPLYALHSSESGGGGNFSDLEVLTAWVAEMGGQTVATLPFLATFPGDNFENSPYLPVSRRLWNEFYVDINSVPELAECPPARAILESTRFQTELRELQGSSLVDYPRQMALKRRVLEELCRYLFSGTSRRLDDLRHFAETHPAVADYARFQATFEKQRLPWRSWPQPLCDGTLTENDYDEADERYHLYAQWLAHQQLENVSQRADQRGVHLYLDLPVGVHPDGYDAWRELDIFVPDSSVGSPPDPVFTRGQDWAFAPLHPEKTREQGYCYTIAYLRHHLRFARILRIDHVMGLHRLFCIPGGMEPRQGVYLRYPAEELYAILALESQRHQAIIVGEDLGTVPPYVKPAMKRHGLQHMYVLHYQLAANPRKVPPPPSHNSVASLNTHDMPPFAAFWQETDIPERLRLGLLDKASARAERQNFRNMKKALSAFLQKRGWLQPNAEGDVLSILRACLSFLADSQARIVLVNLEDLWLETQPQNVPTTRREYPNWQRKARYRFEELCQMPEVLGTLNIVNRLRKQESGDND